MVCLMTKFFERFRSGLKTFLTEMKSEETEKMLSKQVRILSVIKSFISVEENVLELIASTETMTLVKLVKICFRVIDDASDAIQTEEPSPLKDITEMCL